MVEELQSPPVGSTVAAEATAAGGTVPTGEPQPSNARLAAILAKQASGETLTASERGYLGSVKKRAAKKVATVASENVLLCVEPEPVRMAPAASAPTDNPLFESVQDGSIKSNFLC